MSEIFLLILFAILLIHYLAFLKSILKGLKYTKKNKTNINNDFVSVIIPFRNEEDNLIDNLSSIEGQIFDQNRFEVIYVDDNSTDGSYKLLCKNKTLENIKIIKAPPSNSKHSHKKNAVRFGIENSIGEIIVTTDADCTHTKNWLSSIISGFDKTTGFISGPVVFQNSNGLFHRIQKLEFGGLVLAGAGLIGNNSPKICNAANIAYKKDAFLEVDGFYDPKNLSSGDDELLMQKIHQAKKYDVKFLFEKELVVETKPNKNIREFINQRRRWASKSIFYRDNIFVLKLLLIFLFYSGLIIQLFLGFILSKIFFISFLFSFLFKMIVEYKILKRGEGIIFTKSDLNIFFAAEVFQIFYIILASILGLLGNYKWKGRKVKR